MPPPASTGVTVVALLLGRAGAFHLWFNRRTFRSYVRSRLDEGLARLRARAILAGA